MPCFDAEASTSASRRAWWRSRHDPATDNAADALAVQVHAVDDLPPAALDLVLHRRGAVAAVLETNEDHGVPAASEAPVRRGHDGRVAPVVAPPQVATDATHNSAAVENADTALAEVRTDTEAPVLSARVVEANVEPERDVATRPAAARATTAVVGQTVHAENALAAVPAALAGASVEVLHGAAAHAAGGSGSAVARREEEDGHHATHAAPDNAAASRVADEMAGGHGLPTATVELVLDACRAVAAALEPNPGEAVASTRECAPAGRHNFVRVPASVPPQIGSQTRDDAAPVKSALPTAPKV
mmetsp:Transcript_21972/g.51510  ORF Transcript_21972/g.51510 Transcript_21972/m.51510 type:complete len:302 (+) Transcript_21972:2663-3568(+)